MQEQLTFFRRTIHKFLLGLRMLSRLWFAILKPHDLLPSGFELVVGKPVSVDCRAASDASTRSFEV